MFFQGFCDVGQISYKRQLDPQNCQLGSNLVPTWVDFGRVLGSKLEPSWHQMASKRHPTNHQKNDRSWKASRSIFVDFWVQLGGSRVVARTGFWSYFWLLGPSWGQDGAKSHPRGPRSSPRSPKTPSKTDFWIHMIFLDFLMLFRCFLLI